MNFIENESPQKLRGGYYTPPDIAAFLVRWVLQAKPRQLLEPSCGDGVFLGTLAKLKPNGIQALVACEILEEEAEKARLRARELQGVRVTVHSTDFLRWHLRHILESSAFDAAVGNPPFIRYQYLDAASQAHAQRIFEFYRLPFTKHTNAWVPFVVASVAQLRPGGRLAMVVPSELLHVLHAQGLRDFLLAQCSRIIILDPADLWFDSLLQGVVLLLAEKSRVPQAGGRLAIVPVRNREFLNDDPGSLFERQDFISGSPLLRKWMPALLSVRERALLADLREHKAVTEFQEVATVDVGIVTGANKFFLVPDSVVEEYDLQRWAHPMFGRSEHVRGVIFDRRAHSDNRALGLPSNFLWFGDKAITEFPPAVQQYLRKGEKEGLPRRYKCRIRTPWYNVPSVFPSPVGMLKRSHDYPRLILNKIDVLTTDTAYRIVPTRVSATKLVYCFVNSLTALSAELEGRHYGGGVLELVPSEIERVLIPIASVPPGALARLNRMISEDLAPDDILATQDMHVLQAFSLTKQECGDLLSAWKRLRDRRQRNVLDAAEDVEEKDSGYFENERPARAIRAANRQAAAGNVELPHLARKST